MRPEQVHNMDLAFEEAVGRTAHYLQLNRERVDRLLRQAFGAIFERGINSSASDINQMECRLVVMEGIEKRSIKVVDFIATLNTTRENIKITLKSSPYTRPAMSPDEQPQNKIHIQVEESYLSIENRGNNGQRKIKRATSNKRYAHTVDIDAPEPTVQPDQQSSS